MSRWVALVLWFFLAMPLAGAGKQTEAEGLGFIGLVESVSTTTQTFMREPSQPGGPTIIYPLFCMNCQFDTSLPQIHADFADQQLPSFPIREIRGGEVHQ